MRWEAVSKDISYCPPLLAEPIMSNVINPIMSHQHYFPTNPSIAYGGLAARFLLQPLEENTRLLWSRLTSAGDDKLNKMEQSYVVLVKLVLYIGFTFSFLATNYTSILLNILAGKKWGSNDEAIAVLSAFCMYTAFLALNGMTEAFIFGVAKSGSEIGRMGMMHAIVGGIFAVSAPLCVARFGTLGLVAANCVAMLIRSIYSIHFAAVFFASHKQHSTDAPNKSNNKPEQLPVVTVLQRLLIQMFPHWLVMLCFVASAAATKGSLKWLKSQDLQVGSWSWFVLAARHVAVGAFCFATILAVAYSTEKTFQRSVRMLLRTKQD